nr:MAG: ORF1 [Torque teno midi virus]
MPFWWKRRNRNWYGRYRWTKRRRRPYKRRRFTRRRHRRPYRRRRRRRKKVRRKAKKITIKQWQPESIKKCKIKLYGTLVVGAQGRQMFCYTNEADQYPQPKAPGGGGFGCEIITLQYLYEQYKQRNCIWTKTNQYTDLCRYLGGNITLYRHPDTDFIFSYNNQPPFTIEKYTYQDLQPQQMLLKPKKRLILSKETKPSGRLKHKIKFKPPKEMTTKWFFQKDLSHIPLIQFNASAANFRYPTYSPLAVSNMLTINYLNAQNFYKQSSWGQYNNKPYKPYETLQLPLTFVYTKKGGAEGRYIIDNDTFPSTAEGYLKSINRLEGWFNNRVMLAKAIYKGKHTTSELPPQQLLGTLPVAVARYNPIEDTGQGNEVWLTSIFHGAYDKPSHTPDYLIQGVPLYIAFYGYWNFLIQVSSDKGLLQTHMFVVKCRAIKPLQTTTTQDFYPIIDPDFLNSKLPYDEYISESDSRKWFPSGYAQVVTINNIVQSGPYVPRLDNIKYSTWELRYKCNFFFKWGGPQVTDYPVDDPEHKRDYPTPGMLQTNLQITNPEKQRPETLFHDWDYRRGIITAGAIKRMSENLQTDSSIQSDDSETPKKKRKTNKDLPCTKIQESKIKTCLHSLYEESIFPEETQDLKQLIQHQHQQQHKLKRNLLKLILDLKHKQRFLGLQTGIVD